MDGKVRVRFAPSPTGELHVGGARTALFNWLFARKQGGAFVLRIEDTDPVRSKETFLNQILDSLRWLGLDWDEGPEVEGSYGPYCQSQRLPLYHRTAEELTATGNAYRCYCTPEVLEEMRAEQRKKHLPPKYDGRCRNMTAQVAAEYRARGIRYVVRFQTPDQGAIVIPDLIRGDVSFDLGLLDDFILLKSDGTPTFLFATPVDDHEMRISHVIRGEEHLSNTPRQLLVFRALGWGPPAYAHVPILLSAQRTKLSKREGAVSLLQLRDQGFLPEAVRNFLVLLGWSPGDEQELMSLDEMVSKFSLEGVNKAGAVFDIKKLEWLNGEYLNRLSAEGYAQRALPVLREAGLWPAEHQGEDIGYVQQVVELMRGRARSLGQFAEFSRFFFVAPQVYDSKGAARWFREERVGDLLGALAHRLEGLEVFDAQSAEAAARDLAEEYGVTAAKVIHPARLAISGQTIGPSLFEMMVVIGQEECVRRLTAASRRIASGEFGNGQAR